jgi:hypothetical protein
MLDQIKNSIVDTEARRICLTTSPYFKLNIDGSKGRWIFYA